MSAFRFFFDRRVGLFVRNGLFRRLHPLCRLCLCHCLCLLGAALNGGSRRVPVLKRIYPPLVVRHFAHVFVEYADMCFRHFRALPPRVVVFEERLGVFGNARSAFISVNERLDRRLVKPDVTPERLKHRLLRFRRQRADPDIRRRHLPPFFQRSVLSRERFKRLDVAARFYVLSRSRIFRDIVNRRKRTGMNAAGQGAAHAVEKDVLDVFEQTLRTEIRLLRENCRLGDLIRRRCEHFLARFDPRTFQSVFHKRADSDGRFAHLHDFIDRYLFKQPLEYTRQRSVCYRLLVRRAFGFRLVYAARRRLSEKRDKG